MNKNFESFLSFVLLKEGLYSFDPVDRGGETLNGIARNFHPRWSGWAKVDMMKSCKIPFTAENVKRELYQDVHSFYKANYWDNLRCDDLPSGVDMFLADSSIQHGAGTAVKWLQSVAKARVDGVIGPATVASVLKLDPVETVWSLASQRMAYYINIKDDASRSRFGNGWSNRHHAALRMAIARTQQ